jgi:MFS family permease
VTHGLYLLWWVQEKQLSPAVVAAIIAAGDVARLFLEIPTGWFADRFGHRASLVLGSAVQVVAMLWCWLGNGVPALVLASVLVAIGDGFRSGADQALLYRSCRALNREDAFLRIESATGMWETLALAALVVAGGYLATAWSFHAAWLAETLLCAIGLGFACAMSEPPDAAVSPDADESGSTSPLVVNRRMIAIVVPVAFLGAAASATAFVAQTLTVSDPTTTTILVALITMAEAAGAGFSVRVPAASLRGQMVLALLGAALLGAAAGVPASFHIVVIGLAFLEGLAEPLRAAAIQRAADDGVRARVASVAYTCDMLLSTVTLPLTGIWIRR